MLRRLETEVCEVVGCRDNAKRKIDAITITHGVANRYEIKNMEEVRDGH